MNRTRWYLAPLALLFFVLAGCGGGNSAGISNVPTTTRVKVEIQWAARSRAVDAPGSALSATLLLQGANPAGGDFTFTVDRNDSPAAYTQTYTSNTLARTGIYQATVTFYAGKGGQSSIVGIASERKMLEKDSSGIGTILTTGMVASVEIAMTGQSMQVGDEQALLVNVKDTQGHALAVSPGSIFPTIVSGQEKVQIVNGRIRAVAAGTAVVRVSVDGKVSQDLPVTITLPVYQSYIVTDLGEFSISGAYGGINNQGQIFLGSWVLENGETTMLSGKPNLIARSFAVNEKGQLVGTLAWAGPVSQLPALWANKAAVPVNLMSIPVTGIALDINNAGQVVGWIKTGELVPSRAFLWQEGNMTFLPGEKAVSINNKGQILLKDAIREPDGTLTPLGTPPGYASVEGVKINDPGQVALNAFDTQQRPHAFLWEKGQTTDLGNLGGSEVTAIGMNSVGQIVGQATTAAGRSHAFFYRNKQMIDLSTLADLQNTQYGMNDELLTAFGINDKGQIVAFSNFYRGFLLTPKTSTGQ